MFQVAMVSHYQAGYPQKMAAIFGFQVKAEAEKLQPKEAAEVR